MYTRACEFFVTFRVCFLHSSKVLIQKLLSCFMTKLSSANEKKNIVASGRIYLLDAPDFFMFDYVTKSMNVAQQYLLQRARI